MADPQPAPIPEDGPVTAPAAPRDGHAAWPAFRIGVLGGLGLLVAYAVYLSISTVLTTLMVLAVSILLAIGLHPAVILMVRAGLRRWMAVTIAFLVLLGFVAGAVYAIIPPIVEQVSGFIINLPERLDQLLENSTIRSLDERFGLIERLQDYAAGRGPDAASGVFTLAGIVFDLVMVLILTLYFLAGLPRITDSMFRLVPASRRARARAIGDQIISQLGGFLGGATLIAIQAGLAAGLFAWIAGLPYPLALALMAMLLDFVPVVGTMIVAVTITLLGLTQSLVVGIVAAAFYTVQHTFEAYWLYPRVMKRTVHISPIAVIIAILLGGSLLGVMGAVLAVPFAAAVQIIVRQVVMPRQDAS